MSAASVLPENTLEVIFSGHTLDLLNQKLEGGVHKSVFWPALWVILMNTVLVWLGYYNKNAIDCERFKQQTFISHSSGSWGV